MTRTGVLYIVCDHLHGDTRYTSAYNVVGTPHKAKTLVECTCFRQSVQPGFFGAHIEGLKQQKTHDEVAIVFAAMFF